MLNDTFTCWSQASELLHFLSSTLQSPEGKSYLLFSTTTYYQKNWIYFIAKQVHAILSSHTDAWANSSAVGIQLFWAQPLLQTPFWSYHTLLVSHMYLYPRKPQVSKPGNLRWKQKCEWWQHLGRTKTAQQSLNCIPWEVAHNPHVGKHKALREPVGPRTSGTEK